ncbi:hypothetical protein [Flammeovirga kamogawensis]|uniref:DUF1835 domain-containing protein n=1 Tax=Flammeovirga kamogawensis TaxID=373891 RepID=A0ABX8GYB2_9BACT|nr:hypothetical protein [Flammeovirga kamogawensis]MBB6459035.1 hypothetical protein [Flammeovirga kamogawensis]QWG08605.1 hypothetical protein KM029_06625 [Flammeovirga kamogawensis]TRX66898.1 hypothetical protein EO216_01670 [Flammeovirga kamogawensis]
MDYHILNGDSSYILWKQNNFSAEPIIFREMLVEGDCRGKLLSDAFFTSRRHYFSYNYTISPAEYDKLSTSELLKITEIKDAHEVVLWFEYDLFCQINMMSVLAYIATIESLTDKVSIIITSSNKGLGEYLPEEYQKLYNDRIALESKDLKYALLFWKKYLSEDVNDLIPYIHQHTKPFIFLEAAMRAHLERFPSERSGINKLERRLLKFINESNLTKHQLVGAMLRRQTWEGYGDMQYENIIKSIQPLLIKENEEGIFEMTSLGSAVFRGKQKFDDASLHYTYIGGARRGDYYFDEGKNLVVERK